MSDHKNTNREKKATEAFWSGKSSEAALLGVAAQLRLAHWQLQKEQLEGVNLIPSNDSSLYDHLLDHCWLLGIVPAPDRDLGLSELETLCAMGRGLQRPAVGDSAKIDVPAQEMVKWFDR